VGELGVRVGDDMGGQYTSTGSRVMLSESGEARGSGWFLDCRLYSALVIVNAIYVAVILTYITVVLWARA